MTASEEILRALQTAFDETLPTARRTLRREDELVDLGIGSVAALEMAGLIEDRLQVRFPEHQLMALRTVGDFATLIERLLSGKVSAGA